MVAPGGTPLSLIAPLFISESFRRPRPVGRRSPDDRRREAGRRLALSTTLLISSGQLGGSVEGRLATQ